MLKLLPVDRRGRRRAAGTPAFTPSQPTAYRAKAKWPKPTGPWVGIRSGLRRLSRTNEPASVTAGRSAALDRSRRPDQRRSDSAPASRRHRRRVRIGRGHVALTPASNLGPRSAHDDPGLAAGSRCRVGHRIHQLPAIPASVADALGGDNRGGTPADARRRARGQADDERDTGNHIAAKPDEIWPWLVQVGVKRAGWYSYDILDNFGRPSAREIIPAFQDVAVGDVLAMSPDGKEGSTILAMDLPRSMIWATPPDTSWSWTFEPQADGRTRVITRIRSHYRWLSPSIAFSMLLEFADIWMLRKMLLNVRERAEALAHSRAQATTLQRVPVPLPSAGVASGKQG